MKRHQEKGGEGKTERQGVEKIKRQGKKERDKIARYKLYTQLKQFVKFVSFQDTVFYRQGRTLY